MANPGEGLPDLPEVGRQSGHGKGKARSSSGRLKTRFALASARITELSCVLPGKAEGRSLSQSPGMVGLCSLEQREYICSILEEPLSWRLLRVVEVDGRAQRMRSLRKAREQSKCPSLTFQKQLSHEHCPLSTLP